MASIVSCTRGSWNWVFSDKCLGACPEDRYFSGTITDRCRGGHDYPELKIQTDSGETFFFTKIPTATWNAVRQNDRITKETRSFTVSYQGKDLDIVHVSGLDTLRLHSKKEG